MLKALRAAILLFLASACVSCGGESQLLSLRGETMGTTFNVSIIRAPDGPPQHAIEAAIADELSTANAIFSNWDPSSEVSRFNRSAAGAPFELSSAFIDLLEIADFVHVASEGHFDLTSGPLIELWGFGESGPAARIPTDDEILSTLAKVGQQRVIQSASGGMALIKRDTAVSLNVAAIAKGAGIDAIADRLKRMGFDDYLVEIGGDLRASGAGPAGSGWRIAIEKPDARSGDVQEAVSLENHGMATSGDYRNYFEDDGVRYSHVIDPTTGRPVLHKTASVSVIAASATLADAWATALLVIGQDRGQRIAESHGIAAQFLVRVDEGAEFRRYATASFDEYVLASGVSAAQ
ncbi:MAG: FAD:protein FMN transferase [Pseudomonadota bacterium]